MPQIQETLDNICLEQTQRNDRCFTIKLLKSKLKFLTAAGVWGLGWWSEEMGNSTYYLKRSNNIADFLAQRKISDIFK